MGTAVWIDKAEFRMSAEGAGRAVMAVKQAFPSEQVFLARGIHERPTAYRELVNATSIADALRCVMGLGEHVVVHEGPEGAVTGIGREGMMDELPARSIARFFAPLASFVASGSFIEFESDHGSCTTRFEFCNGGLRVVERELGADDTGDWGVIEHDRTEVLLDPTL
ncbi:MAG: hypothetical protein JRG86_19040 [Deltaproteobacteria bacterium]|jgi:hypothetical protein|nr:hypothetical protein [Deltaproteobacteria bacterium]